MLLLLLAACNGRFGDVDDVFFFDSGSTTDTLEEGADYTVDTDGRGFYAWCSGLDVRVEAVAEGVIRVRYGDASGRDSWAVVPQEAPDIPELVIYSDAVAMRNGTIGVVVELDPCRVTVEGKDGSPIIEEPADGGYERGPSLTKVLVEGEHIYGLGERTGGLDRRGGSYTCWNTDAYEAEEGGWGPDADPLYQCVPFYISKRGSTAVGVLTDTPWRSIWDIGATDPDLLTIDADGGPIDQYIVGGPTLPELMARYTTLTGKAPLPPRWSLGFHQSRWGWSPDTEVTDVVDGFRSRDLPLDAVWLDIQHMRGFRSWTWDPDTFPDPAALVDTLAADGVRAISIVDPAIKVDRAWEPYVVGEREDYFLTEGGEPWVGEAWPGDSVFPDFTNPDVRSWWGGLAEADLGYGVAGFWLDMNEPSEFGEGTVPDTLDVDGDGAVTTMAEAHNVYGLLEAQATFAGMQALAPDRRPFLLTRAGYAGIQRYAAAWTGDAPSTFASLEATLPMLLGMGLSGEAWVGSDVGGYSGGASGELYARWMQLGALSPFFRAHLVEGAADQYPWSFGTEVLDISREMLALRYTLLPYFYSLAWETSQTGAPPLRPLMWAFPGDAAVDDLGDEAMLGDWLLVAPIVEEGATSRDVYLPEGRWFEWTSGEVTEGPTTVELVDQPLAALPLYVREGAIVPMGPALAWSDAAPLDALVLAVWPGAEETRFTVYEDAGDGYDYADGEYAATTWTLQRTTTGAILSGVRAGSWSPPERTLQVRVRRADHAPSAVRLDGAVLAEVTEATFAAATRGWWWDEADGSVWIAAPDAASMALEVDYDPTLEAAALP